MTSVQDITSKIYTQKQIEKETKILKIVFNFLVDSEQQDFPTG